MSIFSPSDVMIRSRGRRRWRKLFIGLIALFVLGTIVTTIFYHFKRQSPEYSLARLVAAANSGDEVTFDSLIDLKSLTADFIPQVIAAAREIYGRGADPALVAQAELAANSLTPVVAERLRPVVRQQIVDQTRPLANVPFPILVIAAGEYLDIVESGENAKVRLRNSPSGEIRLQRRGDHWVIVGFRNEQIARQVARHFGDEIMRIAEKRQTADTASRVLTDLLENFELLLKD